MNNIPNMKYKLTKNYCLRYMADSYVLMPVGISLTDESKKPLIINDVTAFIINEIGEKPKSAEEILNSFLKEYATDADEADRAITDVIELMREKSVIEQTE